MSIHNNLTPKSRDSGYDIQVEVKNVIAELNGTFQKLRLYPSDHTICETSLKSFKTALDDFLNQHGDLVLDIDRNKIRYLDEVVHEGPMKEENPAFILFRDGIYLLIFHKSIQLYEIQSFLEVLKKYQSLTEYSENDIVTALWKLKLPSLEYRVDDTFFYPGEDFDIPELKGLEPSESECFEIPELGGSKTGSRAHHEDHNQNSTAFSKNSSDMTSRKTHVLQSASTLNTAIFDRDLWEITPEDQEKLSMMLEEEESWERTEYFIYILLFILRQQKQPDDFSKVLNFLYQEMRDFLKHAKYQRVYNILQPLRNDLDAGKAKHLWTAPLLEDFFARLSDKAFLNAIHDSEDHIDERDLKELDYLKLSLLLLNTDAIGPLVQILLETGLNQTKGALVEIVAIMADREFEYLENILSSPDTDMVLMVTHVMGFMKNEPSFERLLELLHHSSENVREVALRSLFRRNPYSINAELSWLMDDPDEGVRKLFLKYATQHRNVKTEQLLLDYLEKHRIRHGNKQFFFHVYISLGRCGSDHSIPFLEKILSFMPGLKIMRPRKSLRRQAAVYALKELRTEKAVSILNRESKRVLPILGNFFSRIRVKR